MSEESDKAFNKKWYGPFGNFDRGKTEAKKFWDAGIEWALKNAPGNAQQQVQADSDKPNSLT